jgi:orotidine-5'-phosphate decarboxylase
MRFADRLTEAVKEYGPLCVGIDPRVDMLPKAYEPNAEGVAAFCLKVLELVRPYCGVVKPQAAFFEQLGTPGFAAMQAVMDRAKEMGFVTILDAKRGDIASTAQAYAEAAFETWNADCLTVNPYLGRDSVEPFLSVARKAKPQRGLFVLVRTSNPGGGLFQNLNCDGQPLYRRVATEVAAWNDEQLGECGLGDVGAVVGATNPKELVELRQAMPRVWFLVPGYGAQGGTAEDAKTAYLPNGLGAVVNSSRGVVFPFKPDDVGWEAKVVAAAKKAQAELKPS